VDRVDAFCFCLARPFGIEFDCVAIRVGVVCELDKRSSGSRTWVQHGRRIRRVVEKLTKASPLLGRERIVAKFDASDVAHGVSLNAVVGCVV
jgi:hypothetical protein